MPAEEKPVTFIEGLVYLGRVKRVWLEECSVPRHYRVLAETDDGRIYATRCLMEPSARKLLSVWTIYITRGWRVAEG